MYIMDFGNIQFTDNNIKDKIDYLHQINPDGDMLLGVAAMAELKFTLYDLGQLITDADITGREFTFKKSKTSTYLSKWDIFKGSKPDIMCLNGDTVYSVKRNVFSIDGKAVAQQPTEAVRCVYIVGGSVYLGHTDKVSVYSLQGVRGADIALTPFQQTQITSGASLNMQGNILWEYSTRLYDMKPTDFIEKTSVFSEVGIFSAVKPERKNKTNISITSYDRMYKFSKLADDFINNLAYPITAFNLLSSLCGYAGAPLLTTSITNGAYSITKKFAMSNTTARTVLQYIAELSGNFAYIDPMGRVVVRFYAATDKTYTSENFKTIRQLEYATAKIDKVQVKVEANDIGVIAPKDEKKPNAYVIENNPLMYTRSDAELRPYVQALFDKLKDFRYIPTEFTTVLDNDFEGNVGEFISINGTQTPVFVKRIKGLIETYSSSGNAVRDTQTTRLNEAVKMLSGKTNVLINTVDKFSITLTDVKSETEKNSAQLLVQAGQIALKANQTTVETLTGRVSSAEASIKVQSGQIATKVSQTVYDENNIVVSQHFSSLEQTVSGFKLSVDNHKLIFDADGLTIINGGFRIKNSAGENVFYASSTGGISAIGTFTTTDGKKTVNIAGGRIDFFIGNSFVGGIYAGSTSMSMGFFGDISAMNNFSVSGMLYAQSGINAYDQKIICGAVTASGDIKAGNLTKKDITVVTGVRKVGESIYTDTEVLHYWG